MFVDLQGYGLMKVARFRKRQVYRIRIYENINDLWLQLTTRDRIFELVRQIELIHAGSLSM